jgi:hypothetical protein
MRTWMTPFGARVLQLHYEADPEKGLGEKVFVPEINRWLSPWAKKEYDSMTDKNLYRQEYEIDFAARMGQLLFQLDEEATFVQYSEHFKSGIPHDWTRYHACDPHPRVPHSHLWCAVDPFGDRWYYREFWPSKIYGKPGNIPEDDNRYKIKEYVEIIKLLESSDNPENHGAAEKIYRRVIDYAARGMGKGTVDDEPQLNFQERYERLGDEVGIHLRFLDAVKDYDAGVELVNDGLKPLQVEIDGQWVKRSRIHVCIDKCPELAWQLRNNRWKQLTALQADTQDPSMKTVQKRNHCTDLLRYIEMDKPRYVRPYTGGNDWQPMHGGVNY